jgi:DNA helicase II / ATP-dependent DNA helicase PcrA
MTVLHDLLNDAQRHAVEVERGPLMILAGPGSGKTRVIAHRIAHLVQTLHVPPYRILAVTFTNKAAREMRERVESLLGDRASTLTMGTFHSICARILRVDGEAVGLPSDFAIYDSDDQASLVRLIEAELNIDPKRFPPRGVLSVISRAKNERRDAATFQRQVGDYFEEIVGRIYERYEASLRQSGAVDFDDLLGRTFTAVKCHRDSIDALFDHADRRVELKRSFAQFMSHALTDQMGSTNDSLCLITTGERNHVLQAGA